MAATRQPTEMCVACRYFAPLEREHAPRGFDGECRINAPVVVVVDPGRAMTRHPLVSERHWCGDHQPRRTGETAS